MARPVRAMLPSSSSILVVVLLFHFQVADSTRTLSTEEQRQRPRADPTAPAAVVHRVEPCRHHRAAAETGTGRVAGEMTSEDDDGSRATAEEGEGDAAAAPLSSAATTTTSVVGQQRDDGDGIGPRNGRPAAAVAQVLQRSRLARRFLGAAAEVVEGADSAARPSCGSNDVHNGCKPPSEH